MTKKDEQKRLKGIITKLEGKDKRWEAIAELKEWHTVVHSDLLFPYIHHDEWLVRWAVIEKMGDLRDSKFLTALFQKLNDQDPHVVRNTQKAIFKCMKKKLEYLTSRLLSKDKKVRRFCLSFLRQLIQKDPTMLDEFILKENWFIANQLLLLVFKTLKERSEPLLVRAVQRDTINKNALIMLAMIKSHYFCDIVLGLYKNNQLKKHSIQAIYCYSLVDIGPLLIRALLSEKKREESYQIIIEIGQPMVPILVKHIGNPELEYVVTQCLKKLVIHYPLGQTLKKEIRENKKIAEKLKAHF